MNSLCSQPHYLRPVIYPHTNREYDIVPMSEKRFSQNQVLLAVADCEFFYPEGGQGVEKKYFHAQIT